MKTIFRIVASFFIALLLMGGALYFLKRRDLRNQNIGLLRDLMMKGVPIQASEIPQNITANDLIKLLDDTDIHIVTRTLNLLGFLRNEEIVDPIAKKLDSEEWLIRFHSADALGNIGSEKAITPLREAWLKETKWQVSHRIFESLSKIGGESAVQIFTDTFNEPSQTEKCLFATIGLFKLTGKEQYLDSLKESLGKISDKSKLLLVWAVGTQQEKKFRPFLEKAIENGDSRIRKLAEKYLLEFKKKKGDSEERNHEGAVILEGLPNFKQEYPIEGNLRSRPRPIIRVRIAAGETVTLLARALGRLLIGPVGRRNPASYKQITAEFRDRLRFPGLFGNLPVA